MYEPYRGKPHNLGQQLYGVFLEFAKLHGFSRIILDTPKNTDRAHLFYEKAGFRRIEKEESKTFAGTKKTPRREDVSL